MWKNRNTSQSEIKNLNVISILDEVNLNPALHTNPTVTLTQLITTCPIERIFSILCRVKTWTRNTITDNHLNGLCMVAVQYT